MTAPARQDDQRRRELAAIHTAKKQLGLDDDLYRDLLEGLTGKRSAGDLDAGERGRVIERMREIGFQRKVATGRASDRPFAWHANKEHRLIAALWRDLWLLGEVEEPGPRALDKFVQRQAGVAALKWLAPEAAASVVQALKNWLARSGFELPSATAARKRGLTGEAKLRPEAGEASVKDVKKLALTRLVKTQWARLEALGALTFKNDYHRRCALDSYFDDGVASCKKGVDHPMATPVELDKCAALLGAWIRSVRAARPKAGLTGEAKASPEAPSSSTERP